MTSSDPLRSYRQTQIKTASQGQLIVMMYDEALKQLVIAESELNSDQPKLEVAHNAIVKTQDIITELMVSLDFEKGGDIAQNLFHLYMYFNRKLVDSNMSKDSGSVHEIYSLMSDLRGAWVSIEGVAGTENSQVAGGVDLAG